MIAFSATVRGARRNGLGRLLTPLVLLRRFVQGLALALERLIWRELIEDETPANPRVSLLAFLLFSSLCLLVSLQGAVGYVIGLLLFLLPMEWLMARMGYGAPLQRRVELQSWGDRLRLFADTPGGSERLEVDRAAITAVVIRQASVQLPPLGERPIGWDRVLALADPAGEHLLALPQASPAPDSRPTPWPPIWGCPCAWPAPSTPGGSPGPGRAGHSRTMSGGWRGGLPPHAWSAAIAAWARPSGGAPSPSRAANCCWSPCSTP